MAKNFTLGGYCQKKSKKSDARTKFGQYMDSTDTTNTQDKNNIETTKKDEDQNSIIENKQAEDIIISNEPEGEKAIPPSTDEVSCTEKTQDKHKDKGIRINMGFSEENYMKIRSQSEKLSISMVSFINTSVEQSDSDEVDKYINSLSVKPSKDMIPRRRGNKMKRINIRFTMSAHKILKEGAKKHNQTLTQYLNLILSNIK